MELKEYIGNRILYFRKLNNLTQQDLADKLGTTKQTISKYEKGKRKAHQDILFKLCDILGVSINDFFPPTETSTTTPPPSSTTLALVTETTAKLDEPRQEEVLVFAEEKLDEQRKEEQEKVIMINEARYPYDVTEKLAGATGLPNGYTYNSDLNETFTVYSDRKITKRYDIASQVTGDSMQPTYNDGDIVLIQKGFDNVNGAVYAIDYDGKTYIKKVYLEDNHFRLVSINDKYDDIIIDLPVDESLYFNIVGKVVDSFTPVEV